MNRDSVNEYISWLERFEVIYKEYIDEFEDLKNIFAETLEKFKKVLSGSGNIQNLKEERIIELLKILIKKFSVAYDTNKKINKTLEGPRNTDKFKQNIYNTEIKELKIWLMENIDNEKLFPNFESIVMYVAKKRQMIEFLKLTKIIDSMVLTISVYFEIFGKRRRTGDGFRSLLIGSHAKHLHNRETENFQITYKYKDKNFENLTEYVKSYKRQPIWIHTNAFYHPQLFQIMNELYSEFLSLDNRRNNASKRDILPELYWLYMQTCPFERGSASIGEILFSVLLRKHFKGCDFFISNGWNGNPEIIPDIHALHYELDHFKSIFWDQFTNCTGKPNPNINNATANQLRAEVIGL
jgi:hypothetical protein